MPTVLDIITAMQEAAPKGRQLLADGALAELQRLTRELIAAKPDAIAERERFDSIRTRSVPVSDARLGAWLAGKTVLVTGGTGCIGSTLLGELGRHGAARLVSVSRGLTGGWPLHPGVDYLRADITDADALRARLREVRPDVVFHVAAQRDPGLAEREIQRTVRTNIFGTKNVAEAAADAGVAQVICATSGKALRPYSREVYTAAKRAAEWVLASASASHPGTAIAAVRFTHVVDNSIVDDRLHQWAASGVIRLHDPNTLFYAQSALESVQLMLVAGLGATAGALRIYTINDLGMPISLLDLAVGTLQQAGSDSPIYLSGHDPGYEVVAFPGLYDPATAGDVSPLLSAFEARAAQQDADLGIDFCTSQLDLTRVPADALAKLASACHGAPDAEPLRVALDELSWCVYEAALAALPASALRRAAALTEPYEKGLSYDHSRMLAAIRRELGAGRDESLAVAVG